MLLLGWNYLVNKCKVHGKTYACKVVMMPTMVHRIKLCFTVKRNRFDSLPAKPTAAHATAMDCGEIILPVTPPVVLAATVRFGSTPI